MPGAVRPAMQIALFGGTYRLFAAGGAGNVSAAGRQRLENRIEVLHHLVFAADHLAVAALEPPYAATGADIDIMNAFWLELLGATDVVDVIGVAAVDEDVAGFQFGE